MFSSHNIGWFDKSCSYLHTNNHNHIHSHYYTLFQNISSGQTFCIGTQMKFSPTDHILLFFSDLSISSGQSAMKDTHKGVDLYLLLTTPQKTLGILEWQFPPQKLCQVHSKFQWKLIGQYTWKNNVHTSEWCQHSLVIHISS